MIVDTASWEEVLPAPKDHGYAVTRSVGVLMRCAEYYNFEVYATDDT